MEPLSSDATAVENMWQFLKKLNLELPYNPALPCPDIYPKELTAGTRADTCTPTFIATLFTMAKRWKIPTIFIDRSTDSQNVVCIYALMYNGILFCLRNGLDSDTCYKIHETCEHYTKKPAQKDRYCMIPLSEVQERSNACNRR